MSKEYTLKEWLERGKELFGEEILEYVFVCPACKNKQTPKDFLPYLDGDKNEAANSAYVECIGRYTGGRGGEHKCDWAAFGLFDICTTHVFNNGKKIAVFDFLGDNNE